MSVTYKLYGINAFLYLFIHISYFSREMGDSGETDFKKLQQEVIAAKPKAGARVIVPPIERLNL